MTDQKLKKICTSAKLVNIDFLKIILPIYHLLIYLIPINYCIPNAPSM